jgi:carbamoyl-phosphate synthase large subunit
MTAARCTLLVTSAGRRVELINCFRPRAAALGLDLTAIATDLAPAMSAACQVADPSHPTPRCTTP